VHGHQARRAPVIVSHMKVNDFILALHEWTVLDTYNVDQGIVIPSDAAYIEVLQTTAAKPTVKLHLAAIRMLFDWLIIGQVLAVNLGHAVRGPKHVVKRGKTPVLTEEQARQLIQSLDTSGCGGCLGCGPPIITVMSGLAAPDHHPLPALAAEVIVGG
jgi:hypothetical protein